MGLHSMAVGFRGLGFRVPVAVIRLLSHLVGFLFDFG